MENVYRELYYYLFNQITDALDRLSENDAEGAAEILKAAQAAAEEKYIES